MNTLLNLIILQFLIVFVTDYSGFPEDGLKPLFKKLFGVGEPSKLFTCSLCQTTWLGLFYILVTGHFTFPFIAAVAALAALTPVTLDFMHFIKDLLKKIIDLLYVLFQI